MPRCCAIGSRILPETLLDQIPVWLLYALTFLLLLLGDEAGFRLGLWRRTTLPEGEKAPTNAIMGSTLGLLAFLLAFTFGMAASRFDARRQLVVEEASAIMRAYQRSQLLPQPANRECSQLLREYIHLRTPAVAPRDVKSVEAAILRSEQIQDALWANTAKLAAQPSAILAGFIQSLTELTDLQMKRVRAAVWNRMPSSILLALYSVAFLGLMAMGYGAGLSGSRTILPTILLILAFSAIMVLIVDLERPRQRLYSVALEPLAEVARRIGAPAD